MLGAIWINADEVRTKYNDWDFTNKGRVRQAQRMRHLADGVVMAGKIAVADFVCPTYITRLEFNADYVVWMDTVKQSPYEDTNALFERPDTVDYHVSRWFTDTHQQLSEVVSNYRAKNNV